MRLAWMLPLICLGCQLALVDLDKVASSWQQGQATTPAGQPEAHPEFPTARLSHAELLLRSERLPEALTEFERAVAEGQAAPLPDLAHLVHCHTRLLAIAEELEDDYHMHLYRGIGLFLLAQARRRIDDPAAIPSVQGLLCKAAGELARAQAHRPGEARPCWYLYTAWRQLAQQQAARRWLRAAHEAAPFSYLTTSEQADLQLAATQLENR